MTTVVLAMSVSLDGVAGPESADAEGAGLVDEVVLHVVPKLIGGGVRLFGAARADLRCIETVQGEGALHLRYQVQLPASKRSASSRKADSIR